MDAPTIPSYDLNEENGVLDLLIGPDPRYGSGSTKTLRKRQSDDFVSAVVATINKGKRLGQPKKEAHVELALRHIAVHLSPSHCGTSISIHPNYAKLLKIILLAEEVVSFSQKSKHWRVDVNVLRHARGIVSQLCERNFPSAARSIGISNKDANFPSLKWY